MADVCRRCGATAHDGRCMLCGSTQVDTAVPAPSPHQGPVVHPVEEGATTTRAHRPNPLLVGGVLTVIVAVGIGGWLLTQNTGGAVPPDLPSPTVSAAARESGTTTAPASPIARGDPSHGTGHESRLRQVYPREPISDTGRYVNHTLGFACTLPAGWERSEFTDGSGVEISRGTTVGRCTGARNTTGGSLASAAHTLKNNLLDEGFEITYEYLGKETYVVSGTLGAEGYYQWGMVGARETRAVAWTFAMADKAALDGAVTRSMREFATADLD